MSMTTQKKAPAAGDSYRLDVNDGPDGAATVVLCMTRAQALAHAYRINRFLAEIPDELLVLPVCGNLMFD